MGKVLSSCVGFTHMNPSPQPGVHTVLTKLRRKFLTATEVFGLVHALCINELCGLHMVKKSGCVDPIACIGTAHVVFLVIALCKKARIAGCPEVIWSSLKSMTNVHTAIHEQSLSASPLRRP